MAFTTEQLAEVRQAIIDLSTGKRVVSITQNGRTVQFDRTGLPELEALEYRIKTDIQAQTGKRRTRTRLVMTNKGL
ncbi:gpW family protein (plasmid) [Halomonas qaidamensis]|uniref:GpW family protein n=1 Tax=Halomonas qaidamensis TaxID=2866211 RepID=A0ABY6JUC9_9GAMM|nr:gpW family protein [Halomonas qaidamensis]UYV20924.1 gpW family protein [Halomonas qaidamensis]